MLPTPPLVESQTNLWTQFNIYHVFELALRIV